MQFKYAGKRHVYGGSGCSEAVIEHSMKVGGINWCDVKITVVSHRVYGCSKDNIIFQMAYAKWRGTFMNKVVDKDFIIKYVYDLGGLVAVDYEESDELIKIWVVDKPVVQVCPVCGGVMRQRLSKAFIVIEDVPIYGKRVQLMLSRRREMHECDCRYMIEIKYKFKYLLNYYGVTSTDRYIEYLNKFCGYAIGTERILDTINDIKHARFNIMRVIGEMVLKDKYIVKVNSIASQLVELINYINTRYIKMGMPIDIEDFSTRGFVNGIILSNDPIEFIINCIYSSKYRGNDCGVDLLSELEKSDDADATMDKLWRLHSEHDGYKDALCVAHIKHKLCECLRTCYADEDGIYRYNDCNRFKDGYDTYMDRINSLDINGLCTESNLDDRDIKVFALLKSKGIALRHFSVCDNTRCAVISDYNTAEVGWDSDRAKDELGVDRYYVTTYRVNLFGNTYHFYFLPKIYNNGEYNVYSKIRIKKVRINSQNKLECLVSRNKIEHTIVLKQTPGYKLKYGSMIKDLALAYFNSHCSLLKYLSISVEEDSINIRAAHCFSSIIGEVKAKDKSYKLCDFYGKALMVTVENGDVLNIRGRRRYVGLPLKYKFDQDELDSFMNILGSEFEYVSHKVIGGIYHIKVMGIPHNVKCVKCGGGNLSYVTQSLTIKTISSGYVPVEFEVINHKIYRCNDDRTIFKLRYPFKVLDDITDIKS